MMPEKVTRARNFAVAAHGDQKYGDQPYVAHLDAVVQILAPFGEQAQVAGYLHDVVEDTAVSLQTIRDEFGSEIADCVALLTDEPGSNRKERKRLTNKKLSAVGADRQLALFVKAADRLANVRQSAQEKSGSKLEMYRREHSAFREAAYRPRLCDEIWEEMDRIFS
jgi:guanosine-3',5'-bis(diphosphate) 3'-pyrophosphohydrolase